MDGWRSPVADRLWHVCPVMATRASTPFLSRVRLRNYRSIARCDVELAPLTILVGPNGSGKSNFLDALRLTAESLRSSLDHALRERGGVSEVRRKSSGHPNNFSIELSFAIDGRPGRYGFGIAARKDGNYDVQRELCEWGGERYEVRSGVIRHAPAAVSPPAVPDRLYLVNAAGLPAFRPVFDALSTMGFYNLSPAKIRQLQPPDQGDLLEREGTNLASVLARLERTAPQVKERIASYLGYVVSGIEGVSTQHVGHMETLEFYQRVVGAKEPWRFPALNMSDGTLRALAVLTAIFQFGNAASTRLVGIEEPETALHPAAANLLLDCLREGARDRQIVVTTHSPDLLDHVDVGSEALLAVSATEGSTTIGPIDQASRRALVESTYTAGELLRLNQLAPDASMNSDDDLDGADPQLDIFAGHL